MTNKRKNNMSTHGEAVEDIKKAKAVLDEQSKGGFSYEKIKNASQPDPKKHLYISLVKSAIRIGAGACLILGFPVWCGVAIVAAEVLGIAEELV
jgi:hypothetical protein